MADAGRGAGCRGPSLAVDPLAALLSARRSRARVAEQNVPDTPKGSPVPEAERPKSEITPRAPSAPWQTQEKSWCSSIPDTAIGRCREVSFVCCVWESEHDTALQINPRVAVNYLQQETSSNTRSPSICPVSNSPMEALGSLSFPHQWEIISAFLSPSGQREAFGDPEPLVATRTWERLKQLPGKLDSVADIRQEAKGSSKSCYKALAVQKQTCKIFNETNHTYSNCLTSVQYCKEKEFF